MVVSDGNAGKRLRSGGSYGKLDRNGFIHRSWTKSQGLPAVMKALEPFLDPTAPIWRSTRPRSWS